MRAMAAVQSTLLLFQLPYVLLGVERLAELADQGQLRLEEVDVLFSSAVRSSNSFRVTGR